MKIEKTKQDRKKVSIDKQTYTRLSEFSRCHDVKPQAVLDAIVMAMLQDQALAQRVFDISLSKMAEDLPEDNVDMVFNRCYDRYCRMQTCDAYCKANAVKHWIRAKRLLGR